MSFHFVDRIHAYEPGKWIKGVKNVTRNEGLYYWLPSGHRVMSPAVITEALLQLGGWLKLVSTDFTRRPVILADERTDYRGFVTAGDQVELFVEVLDFGDDVVVTRGSASVDGKEVLVGHCARGYLLPADEFSDPADERRRFNILYKPELAKIERVGAVGTCDRLKPVAGAGSFEALRFVDGVIEHVPFQKIRGFKNLSACEPYFATHFPRKPCVPGVLQLSFVGELCQYLLKEDLDAPMRSKALVPTFIRNVRFRKFLEPGDQCVLDAEVAEGDLRQHNQDVLIKATISANGKRVLQAEMGFRTMFAANVALDLGTFLNSPQPGGFVANYALQ
jgi:3-hydroxymyristoyl/3-hydroxydecanoyl-(acyl carrier protein) dehydratase